MFEKNNLLSNRLRSTKSLIDHDRYWDNSKRQTNEYERIPFFKSTIITSPNFFPTSRSYFKLIEILSEFQFNGIIDKKTKCACICEGPGGFVQAIHQYANKHNFETENISCITLISTQKNVPKMKLDNSYSYKLHYGLDMTGNIYDNDNITHFVNEVGPSSCDIVTADGGFDFSFDFNSQEKVFQTLLLCEILTTLKLQKQDGMCVLKLFDVFDKKTIQLVTILNMTYSTLCFVKPKSSRPANSEKYLVCRGFKRKEELINSLEYVLLKKLTLDDICDYDSYRCTLSSVFEYNKLFVYKQIGYINKTIDYSKQLHCTTYESSKNDKLCREWVSKYACH